MSGITKKDIEAVLAAAKDSDTPLGAALGGMQQGMMMGISRSMELKFVQRTQLPDLVRFLNEKDDNVWRCAVSVCFYNQFWWGVYYEGTE